MSLVSKIPVEQKAEVWNFWELITITVKLCTQVYVEDSNKQSQNTNVNQTVQIIKDKKPTLISQPYLSRPKKSPTPQEKLCPGDAQAEDSKDYGQDLEHTDNESVKSFVKTLDFTDLISCPGSVDNVSSQDGTCSMFYSPPCSTPSATAITHSVDSSSCSATPHTPRVSDDRYTCNFSSVNDENFEKVTDKDSITMKGEETSVDEINDDAGTSATENTKRSEEIIIFLDHTTDIETVDSTEKNDIKTDENSESSDKIDAVDDAEGLEIETSTKNEGDANSQTLHLNLECDNSRKNEETLQTIDDQTTCISQEKQKGKENKIPLLKIRKSKKQEETIGTLGNKHLPPGVRYLNRKSSRRRTEVRHDEFVYEVVESSNESAKRSLRSSVIGSGTEKLKCNECGKVLSNRTSLTGTFCGLLYHFLTEGIK